MTWPNLKLSSHHHSGKYLPHQHTSYALLFFLTLLCGLAVFGAASQSSAFDGPVPPPTQGIITLNVAVLGPPPSLPAIINSPTNGQHFGSPLIGVSGTCQRNYLVKVNANDIFVGGVFCSTRGTFSLQVQLFNGQNRLTAHNFDALDQSGPDSNSVTVFDDESLIGGQAFYSPKLAINATDIFKGYAVGEVVNWTLSLIGGKGPYAINVDWGDGSNPDLISRNYADAFIIKHIYQQPGHGPNDSYDISVKATDASGQNASLQLATIVRGPLATAITQKPTGGGGLMVAWPLLTLAWLMILGFWLGESYVKQRILVKQSPLSGI